MKKDKTTIRNLTRGAYDLQKLRIQMGNRVVANFRVKLGIQPSEKEAEADKAAASILSMLRSSFMKITDGVTELSGRIKYDYDGVIDSYTELRLIASWIRLTEEEKFQFKSLEAALKDHKIWTEFLADVKGCGPTMGAVIISEIDIEKAKYPSSLWKYAGVDVVKGEGRSRKKDHLEETTYVDGDGNKKTKMGITFNPFLKTKLIRVLGSSFLMSKGPYADIYYDYRHRIETDPAHADKSKGHIHNMSVRYAVKMFLKDLYDHWRDFEGLPVSPTYHEAKQGHKHTQTS